MGGLLLLFLLILVPLVLFIGESTLLNKNTLVLMTAVYLALSSCLGDSLRRRRSSTSVPVSMTSFGKQYAMNLNSGVGQGGWEQIEMENMLDPKHDQMDGPSR
jgi:hypothetical protein